MHVRYRYTSDISTIPPQGSLLPILWRFSSWREKYKLLYRVDWGKNMSSLLGAL
jgi:hypothetical protein